MSTAPPAPEGDSVTIGFTAAAAVLLGSAAVLVSTWLTSDFLRLLLGMALAAYGVVVWRGAAVTDLGRPRPLGVAVERALGAAAALFGADLVATAVVASIVDATSEEFTPPSPTLLTFIRYGLPLAVLVAMAFRAITAGPVGAGLVLSSAVAIALGEHGPGKPAFGLVLLVIAGVATLLVLTPGARSWARFATVAGATTAALAAGAGTSPVTALDIVTGQPWASQPGLNLVFTVLGMAIAAVLLALAVHRRDVAGALVSALVFTAPPDTFGGTGPASGTAVLLIVPAAAVLVTLPAWATARVRPPVAQAAIGLAALVFAVQALPALGWPARIAGAAGLVVFAVVFLLACRLPGLPGAVMAGALLVGLTLEAPWYRLVAGDQAGRTGLAVAGLLDLVVTAAAVWLLVKRHPRTGVIAAAAYCAAGTLAHSLFDITIAGDDPGHGVVAAVIMFGPLVVLGGIAAFFALRNRFLPIAQAVGAVVLAMAGFALVVVTGWGAGFSVGPAQHLIDVIMAPLAPTSTPYLRMIVEATAPLLVAAALLVLLAAVFAATLARRPSASLTAATALVAVTAAQCGAVLTLDFDAPIGLGPVAAIAVVCGLASAGVAAGAGRRFRHRRAEPAQPLPQE